MQTLIESKTLDLQKNIKIFTREYLIQNKHNLRNFYLELVNKNFISLNTSFSEKAFLVQSISEIETGVGLFLLTQFVCVELLEQYGNDFLKKKYFDDLKLGKQIAALAITEKNAGSNIGAVESKINLSNKQFILNGEKTWVSNGEIADLFFAFAKDEKEELRCLIVEKNDSVQIEKEINKIGIQSTPSNIVFFNNVQVEADNVLTAETSKLTLFTAFEDGRIFCAAQAVGLLDGILNECVIFARIRKQFNNSISNFQCIQWYLADMKKDLNASKLLFQKALWARNNNIEQRSKISSMAKLFSTSRASMHASVAVQIFGGSGLVENSYVARAYRNAKVLEIYEGTDEIQRVNIGRQIK